MSLCVLQIDYIHVLTFVGEAVLRFPQVCMCHSLHLLLFLYCMKVVIGGSLIPLNSALFHVSCIYGEGWESESEGIDDDSLYLPTPDRPVEVNYIDLPNKLCFLALPQVGDMINEVRGCKTPGCNGNLAPTGVMSKGFGGCVYVSCRCDGCGSGGYEPTWTY